MRGNIGRWTFVGAALAAGAFTVAAADNTVVVTKAWPDKLTDSAFCIDLSRDARLNRIPRVR